MPTTRMRTIFSSDKMPLRVFVSAGDAVQKSGGQFSDEKIVRIRVVGIAHALGFGRNKARLAVKVYFAGNGKRPCSHFPGFVPAKTKGVLYADDPEADYFLIKELKPGFLDGVSGTYKDPDGYFVCEKDPEGFEQFEATFPAKEKQKLPGQLF